jgi:outer membrane scaffolding protein for murein synthesis (MipA/OmpV family)
MGFIRNALFGVALYEAIRYFLKTGEPEYANFAQNEPQPRKLIREEVDVVKGARQTGHLEQMQLNAKADREASSSSGGLASEDDAYRRPVVNDLSIGSDPEANLTGPGE